MDVHPTKNVSIGIDPYPLLMGPSIYPYLSSQDDLLKNFGFQDLCHVLGTVLFRQFPKKGSS
jgi:hypothetical protein